MNKEKIQIEYNLNNISLNVLWNCLSTPSGLSEWFADDVNISGKIYTFTWEGTTQQAELSVIRTGCYIRFHWIDDEDNKTYFEFKISPDELTNDVALIITDFISPGEKKDTIELWNKQIEKLKRQAGM
jgi:uncharacterized protein YndB with AHSA1/START domain